MLKAGTSSHSLASLCNPSPSIEAEARWVTFVSKHNIAPLVWYFARCFLTQRLRGSFTKTTAIVKEALAPHFLKKATNNMAYHYSLMIDESNDNTNKSCIILGRVCDRRLCDVVTTQGH